MQVKQPTSYEQQVELMRSRGLIISKAGLAIDFLEKVRYYRLSGYLLLFKTENDTYIENTTFEQIAGIYSFDEQLRNLLALAIGRIEIYTRSVVSHYHSHKYGALGYLDENNFDSRLNHDDFISQLNGAVQQNKSAPFVSHHLRKYDGKFPLWVAVELFSAGMLSSFYARMNLDDRKIIASEFCTEHLHLNTWLHCMSVLRNVCAHYGRLYGVQFHKNPRLPRQFAQYADTDKRLLFKQMYMLKLLHCNMRDDWDNIVAQIYAMIDKYDNHISLSHIGFPDNWENALTWKQAKK